jgi:hypothetical protein
MTCDGEEGDQDVEAALISLAVESWRFSRMFSRVVKKLDAGEAERYVNQARYFHRRLEESLACAKLRLVELEGHPFDPGMAVEALNLADFAPDEPLLIEQVVEPIVMGPNGLRRQGIVRLRKAHQ